MSIENIVVHIDVTRFILVIYQVTGDVAERVAVNFDPDHRPVVVGAADVDTLAIFLGKTGILHQIMPDDHILGVKDADSHVAAVINPVAFSDDVFRGIAAGAADAEIVPGLAFAVHLEIPYGDIVMLDADIAGKTVTRIRPLDDHSVLVFRADGDRIADCAVTLSPKALIHAVLEHHLVAWSGFGQCALQ